MRIASRRAAINARKKAQHRGWRKLRNCVMTTNPLTGEPNWKVRLQKR